MNKNQIKQINIIQYRSWGEEKISIRNRSASHLAPIEFNPIHKLVFNLLVIALVVTEDLELVPIILRLPKHQARELRSANVRREGVQEGPVDAHREGGARHQRRKGEGGNNVNRGRKKGV